MKGLKDLTAQQKIYNEHGTNFKKTEVNKIDPHVNQNQRKYK